MGYNSHTNQMDPDFLLGHPSHHYSCHLEASPHIVLVRLKGGMKNMRKWIYCSKNTNAKVGPENNNLKPDNVNLSGKRNCYVSKITFQLPQIVPYVRWLLSDLLASPWILWTMTLITNLTLSQNESHPIYTRVFSTPLVA